MFFNVTAGVQLGVVAVPVCLVYAALHFGMGWESAPFWAAIIGGLCLVPVDLLTRISAMGGGEDEPGGPMALIRPASGVQLGVVAGHRRGRVRPARSRPRQRIVDAVDAIISDVRQRTTRWGAVVTSLLTRAVRRRPRDAGPGRP